MIKNRKGFTLTEIIVAIAVIGILSSILYSSYSKAKMMARDTVRIAEITEIANALDQYYAKHRRYPVRTDGGTNPGYYISRNAIYWDQGPQALANELGPYLTRMPHPPLEGRADGSMGDPGANAYHVYIAKSGQRYRIVSYLATSNHPQATGAHHEWGSYIQINKNCMNPLNGQMPDNTYELCCDFFDCRDHTYPHLQED